MTQPIKAFVGDYRFLSNFYPAPITYKGIDYPTTEHAYQAQKSTKNSDKLTIAATATPAKAKVAARMLKRRSNWDKIKVEVMLDVLRLKFEPGSDLAKKLLATNNAKLYEGNTWGDIFWGVYEGKGENKLGKLLMQVRKELRKNGLIPKDDPILTGKTKRTFSIRKIVRWELALHTINPSCCTYESLGEFNSIERAKQVAESIKPGRKINIRED
jgi:ribA/ribD-fused uncharacterized protein